MCPALFFIVVCLFVPCPSEGGEDFCKQPPKKNHTKPLRTDCLADGKELCRVNGTLRYDCEEGYVRKAGTSGLIKCKLVDQKLVWEEAKSSIQCICKGTRYAICPADSTQTPTMPPSECPERKKPKSTEAPTAESEPPDCSEGCDATQAPGETPSPESGTVITPARILSTEKKITIAGAAGGLFIIIVVSVGIGIHLNHNRGVYSRARQEEPMGMDHRGDTPTTSTTPPQEP
ncbi:interleukin-15 receptor subunit alpha isoform X2 [Osmerus mordax]|uniref:interleukin-15 receptor subunit alpha isoform X2 n=1 Tax=Osmerus mordax TaxID=8014 RepID=UPI00350F212F